MIAPATRALMLVAGATIPASLLYAAWPADALWWLLPPVLAGAALLLDAYRALVQDASVTLRLPPVTHLTRGRAGRVPLQVEKPAGLGGTIRAALSIPDSAGCGGRIQEIVLERGMESVTVPWPLTPPVRGRFPIRAANLEVISPWGCWRRRVTQALDAELRVYPNLLAERTRLAAQFLNRPAAGVHAQRQVGKGREFERLREYVHGDGYEDLHWKASARRGRPITKVFQLERTQEVYVAIDISRLSARCGGSAGDPGGGERLIERFITAGLTLGIVAERQGDQFGLATFSDRPQAFLRAARGPGHFHACRDLLYTAEPRLVNPDFAELFTFLRLRLRRRALVVVVTDLSDPVIAETFIQHVALLRERHVVLAAHVTAPGVKPIFTGGPVQQLEDVYAALAGHLQWHDLHERVRTLALRGVPLRLVEEAALAPALVDNYMTVKRRQLL